MSMFMHLTSLLLDTFPVTPRGCLLPNELPAAMDLGYIKRYSSTLCLWQCKVVHLLEMCKCLPWHVPRFEAGSYFHEAQHATWHYLYSHRAIRPFLSAMAWSPNAFMKA